MLATAILLFALAQGPCQAAATSTATQPATTAPAAQPAQPEPAPAPAEVRIPAGAVLQVELVDPLSSLTSKLGDKFVIRLVEPISVDGKVVVPAGATGQGEVIDAGRSGMSGSQGKLIISARYLTLNGQQVRVRGMTLMVAGTSRVDLATGLSFVPYVGIASMFIKGGEIVLPAGTRATVKVAQDVVLPPPAPTATVAATAAPATTTTATETTGKTQ